MTNLDSIVLHLIETLRSAMRNLSVLWKFEADNSPNANYSNAYFSSLISRIAHVLIEIQSFYPIDLKEMVAKDEKR